MGRAVLRGECDLWSLQPRSRWVGGVQVVAASSMWRWDEAKNDAVWR
jgi:hypothetical protein